MRAYHNDPAVKAKYVNRLAAHRAAENLVQGEGWDGTKGCAVGCTLERYDRSLYPVELGLPEWLARLEDRIFEGLPERKAEQFAEDFLAAIPVGADVSKVRSRLAVLRLNRQLPALDANPEPYAKECAAALRQVIAWHDAVGGGVGGEGGALRLGSLYVAWLTPSRTGELVMTRIEFWPTRDGLHIVEIHPDRTIRHAGVLWILIKEVKT
jgi:hypothetical protein